MNRQDGQQTHVFLRMTLTLFKLVHSFSNALVFGYMLLSKMAAEIKEQMTGKWKIYHRENMDAILEASGKFQQIIFTFFSSLMTNVLSSAWLWKVHFQLYISDTDFSFKKGVVGWCDGAG